MKRSRFGRRVAVAVVWCAAASAGSAQVSPAASEPQVQAPLRDPWVPPHARPHSVSPPTEGAALKAQIEAKLRASFEAAAQRAGTLTREQAKAAGLGYVAENFERIDTRRTGRVSFDDVKRYLRSQGADL